MRTALKQTERLGRLVETLLDLSRLDNGVVTAARRALRGVAVSVGRAEGGQHGRRGARARSGSGSHTRTDVHLHLDVSPPELTAHADAERHPPGRRQPDRQRGQAQPAARPGHACGRGAGRGRSRWSWRCWTRARAFRAAERHRVFERFNRGEAPAPARRRAATAARGSGWRSPAGRSICTAAGSEWPNPLGAAGSMSPFRETSPLSKLT